MFNNLLKDLLKRYWWGVVILIFLVLAGIWWYGDSQKVEVSGYKISREAAIAVEYYKNGDLVKAEEQYKAVVKSNPRDWFSWNGLANVYREKGKYELAEEAYLKAIDINRKFEQAYRNIYVLYYVWSGEDADKIYEAEDILVQGVRYLPKSEIVLEEILNYYQKTNNPEQFTIYQDKLNKLRNFKSKQEGIIYE
ncbi:tetratricopeptide repeat protein [Patescibacteria group bacterium]|nr:tetratricopeptide repeat protein [Patescibacteria group bacterium]